MPLITRLKLAGVLLGLILLGAGALVAWTYWSQGPYTSTADAEAAMERLKDADLADAGFKLDRLKALLGMPEYSGAGRDVRNASWKRWYRGAVTCYANGDEIISLTISDADRVGTQPFWGKTVFRGALNGLRLGDPAPSAERRAALNGLKVYIQEKAGRVTAVTAENGKFAIIPTFR